MEGVLGDRPYEVVGAFYYALKSLDRSKGFSLLKAPSDFLPPGKGRLKALGSESFEHFMEEARQQIFEMTTEIVEGTD